MTKPPAKLKLGAFFNPTGHHVASWRHPEAQADAGVNFAHYAEITRTAERGKFHLMFLADNVSSRPGNPEAVSKAAQYVANFEPLTLLGALSAVTERIGLVATASTSYNEPYHVARKFASLDHLSGGRAGWNIVTSAGLGEAQNFNRDEHYEHEERYERAIEFTEIVLGLWDSWDDDAFVRDKATGQFFDPAKVRPLNHKGDNFKVRGPLNVPRPPQGHPVLVQAGSSPTGRDFGARYGEILFTGSSTIEAGRAFYDDIKGRAEGHGRRPEHVNVMPGICPVVGRTAAEAQEKFEFLQSLIPPIVGRELLGMMLGGADLSACDVDGPLPTNLPRSNMSQASQDRIEELARQGLSIRQLYMLLGSARGQRAVVGTASQIADEMEAWLRAGAADGFNVMPTHLPGGLNDFVDMVIPELQRRELFRTEYEGETLRENLGLPRPPSRYA
jgi:N-acetyl-S-(2-succino)cysteine monooxygenase